MAGANGKMRMNGKIKKAIRLLTDSEYRFHYLTSKGFYDKLSDEAFLKKKFRIMVGEPLNLEDPQTFNEKLQWLKLYNRRPEYSRMVDKYEVKEYVAQQIGAEYIIPNLGVWDRFEDIDFDALPDRFVLKCTHDSGGLVICKDKSKLDREAARIKLERSLATNFYLLGREWPYKNVKPRIMAEAYMEDTTLGELRDYKFFTFGGKCKALYIVSSRYEEGVEIRFNFFDSQFNPLDIFNDHPNASKPIEKPQCYDLMVELAEKLAQGIPHVRVDFYEVDGKVYFGEMTFFHNSGFSHFQPEKWEYTFGSWLELPKEKIEEQ